MLHRRYLLERVIGRGSFGQVVKALDTHTGEHVAVKIVKADAAYLAQAAGEARLTAFLNRRDPTDAHAVLRLRARFVERGHQCLVLELLSVSLYDLLRSTDFAGFIAQLTASRRAAATSSLSGAVAAAVEREYAAFEAAVSRMLVYDPAVRISASEALRDKFFAAVLPTAARGTPSVGPTPSAAAKLAGGGGGSLGSFTGIAASHSLGSSVTGHPGGSAAALPPAGVAHASSLLEFSKAPASASFTSTTSSGRSASGERASFVLWAEEPNTPPLFFYGGDGASLHAAP
ncbi:hypothetical protein I4F81_003100 [Pyropia yezoensis]|uniref:Uncharacterized protein n=1 Tax=Pyropia yezoensis TaxID=2788 RepID=A0ACC3BST9_PYRYE|nr:hypothetical protein I4F81_003100 [Neopyropia yezoensis]